MKLICALILWQVLLQVSKEDTVSAEPNQIDKHSEKIDSKNIQIQILKEEVIGLKRELESKNHQLKNSQEIETELRRELESKYDSMGKCSMPTVRGELSRQQKVMEKLEKNLSEKQKDEMDQLYRKIYSKSENLENCENRLTILENTSVTKDQKIYQLEKELTIQKNTGVTKDRKIYELESKVQRLGDKIKDKHGKRCIDRNSITVHYETHCQAFEVLCNSKIAGPGWTVIQQRIDGKVDFYRNWTTYQKGFGEFWNGSFFLGLEKIHRLTAEEPHELYIHMERFDGSSYYARYDEFAIAGEDDQYRLIKLGAFSGSTEQDKMRGHENMQFSTYDRDNDAYVGNCAKMFHGAWWYHICAPSNLNGRYYSTEVWENDSTYWEGITSLKQVKMMIRPKVA